MEPQASSLKGQAQSPIHQSSTMIGWGSHQPPSTQSSKGISALPISHTRQSPPTTNPEASITEQTSPSGPGAEGTITTENNPASGAPGQAPSHKTEGDANGNRDPSSTLASSGNNVIYYV